MLTALTGLTTPAVALNEVKGPDSGAAVACPVACASLGTTVNGTGGRGLAVFTVLTGLTAARARPVDKAGPGGASCCMAHWTETQPTLVRDRLP